MNSLVEFALGLATVVVAWPATFQVAETFADVATLLVALVTFVAKAVEMEHGIVATMTVVMAWSDV